MTLTPEQEQRIRALFKLIADEKDPEKVQVLAGELGRRAGHRPQLPGEFAELRHNPDCGPGWTP